MHPHLKTLALITLSVAVGACGGAADPQQGAAKEPRVPLDTSALTSSNGMSTNGMSTNGMSTNGLALSGLNAAYFESSSFSTWFATNPSYSDMVMQYLAKCALPSGVTVNYVSLGVTYTWVGELGLAPQWASGNPAPLIEQQLVSACFAAHANKYGVHMSISVRGYQEGGALIPVGATEQSQFDDDEGCYFGNIFDGTGVFSAYSSASPLVQPSKTSERACAISGGQPGQCAPMVTTGQTCQSICQGSPSAITGAFEFTSCVWHGVSYAPITVRIEDSEIATCGDGVCAASESCYNPWNGTGCKADCGTCFN